MSTYRHEGPSQRRHRGQDRRRSLALALRATLALGVLALATGAAATLVPVQPHLEIDLTQVPANGMASATVAYSWRSVVGNPVPAIGWTPPTAQVTGDHTRFQHSPWQQRGRVFHMQLRSTRQPGQLTVTVPDPHGQALTVTVQSLADAQDADGDGFPNAVELVTETERARFRAWFSAIASSQYIQTDSEWYTVHRDCAGLVRYAFKEALKRHDSEWWQTRAHLQAPIAPDLESYRYPDVPVLGTHLFRTGSAHAPFGDSASARALRDENTQWMGFDLGQGQSGDLLFYERDGSLGRSMHTMILIRRPTDGELWVVYHTGPSGETSTPDGTGTVKLLKLEDLLQHPDPAWHPSRDNPSFTGLYRWHILV